MTDKKRNFLQETAFEEDVNLDEPFATEEQKRAVAKRFEQWMEKDKK